jgi:hypothetical protein
VLIYLFRNNDSSGFAYSTDVTGQNLPAEMPNTRWSFVETIDAAKSVESPEMNFPEIIRRLQADGFYVFEKLIPEVDVTENEGHCRAPVNRERTGCC